MIKDLDASDGLDSGSQPPGGQELDAVLDRLWVSLAPELVKERPARRRWPVYVGAAGLVLTVSAGGVAAATEILSARTGEQSTGHDVVMAGPGEWLRADAPDMPEVARQLGADIPFAPGYEGYRTYTYKVWLTSQDATETTESAVRGAIAHQAICSWVDYWVAADGSGDRAARDVATQALGDALHWPAVTTLDPHPDPALSDPNLPGSTYPSLFGYLPRTVRSAQAGDADDVARSLFQDGSTSCVPEQLRAIDADRLLRESAK